GLEPHVVEGDFNQGSGHASARKLMDAPRRFDGVFCGNDMMAIGALLAFQEAGVRCPEDIAVVGFDDVPIAALVRPGLTTLRIRIAETGRRALQRLVGQIDAAQAGREATASSSACEVVRPELVIRTSTRASVSTTRAADGRPSGVTASAQGENQDG
ncbi:MAG: substrate-binding domain-containing protein, partial [Brevundimonas sp.]|nr:substrate-binding domain-containing protein [Brevundimonas sp.]